MGRRLSAFLVILAVAGVFWPVFSHQFLEWDDHINIVDNPNLNPATVRGVADFWRNPTQHHMYPLTSTVWSLTSLAARRAGGELAAWPFHGLNVLLHTLSSLVVLAILRTMLLMCPSYTGAQPGPQGAHGVEAAALFGALLFALHPVQVEPVSWCTGGKDLLSALSALSAVWLLLRAFGGGQEASPRRTVCDVTAATAAFALAILAKPTGIAAAAGGLVLVFLCNSARSSHDRRRLCGAVTLVLVWMLLAARWLQLTKFTQRDELLSFVAPWPQRAFVALDALAFYVYKLLVPALLGPDYGRSPRWLLAGQGASRLALHLTWLIPVGLLVPALLAHRRRLWLCLLATFVALLLPVLGLVPFAHQTISTVADRYLYPAMLVPALALALALQSTSGAVWRRGCIALLLLLGLRSHVQTRYWRDTGTLFQHALRVNPNSVLSHYNLGLVLAGQGNLESAVSHYEAALRIEPAHAQAHNNLGKTLVHKGELEQALAHFSAAVRLDAGDADIRSNLATALKRGGQIDNAITQYSEALRLNPRFVDVHFNLAMLYARQGRTHQALAHAKRGAQLAPTDTELAQLVRFLEREGRDDR